MIRHTVTFSLKHEKGSDREQHFLADARRILSAIAGVEQFEVLRQTGAKNNFSYGLSMEFANQEAYDFYNNHPDHVAFVRDRWLPEVKEFLEIDYVPMTG
ncbi:Dabb family protein [Hoeflea sp. G2-23]|uniref:Dabb family protein n=1 Tax=Hoeflea algicola TaxID=2983763 RepID=A0ABT3ZF33_9HYPH|nr:Dabb family protein [Hoeflea algicola]MCY0150415.1 Dabb family protein [Hoeflea algicola]